MCFMSCLAHVVGMATVMQMRQPQEEGETQEEEKPPGGRNPKEPHRALYIDKLSLPECPHPSNFLLKKVRRF